MSKNILATSLTTALLALPLLAGCKNTPVNIVIPPGGLTLPDCAAGQFLTVGQDKALNCTSSSGANLSPKACPATGYASTFEGGQFECGALGSGTTNSDLSAAINNLVTKTTNLQTQINNFGGGGGAAKYCGQTSGTTAGRITSGTAVGIAAAAILCQAVAGCGGGSHMCTPYEMFESVSAGVVTQAQTITKSWVYMAAWQNTGVGNEPTAGLSDNCGSYTYPTGDLMWRGTAVKWEPRNNGEKVLKFYTGNTAPEGATCSEILPIACCK